MARVQKIPITSTGKPSTWEMAEYVLIVEEGMSAPASVEAGVIQPYIGKIFDRLNKVKYQCYGVNWSRTRGELESWVYANAG